MREKMNMDTFDKYKYLLGETIMLYQLMENDLRLMFAGMTSGDFYENLEKVKATYKGLGQLVQALEQLDNMDSSPYFTRDTYALLNRLARQRNYYCHQCCLDFCYNPQFRETPEYKQSLERLEKTNEIIKSIQAQTNRHRELILSRYNRI